MGKLVTKRAAGGRGAPGSASGRHFTSGYPYSSSRAAANAVAAGQGVGQAGAAAPSIPRHPPPPLVRRTGSGAGLATTVVTTTVGFSLTETGDRVAFDWGAAAAAGGGGGGGGAYRTTHTTTFYRQGSSTAGRRAASLKRLDFVASCGADLAAMAAAAYRAGRALWPALLASPLAFVEGKVASAAAPLLAGAAYRAERLLELADAQVDGVVSLLPGPLLKAVGALPGYHPPPRPALPGLGGHLDLSAMFLPPPGAASSAGGAPGGGGGALTTTSPAAPHLRLAAVPAAARAMYLDQVRGAAEAIKAVSGAPASARAAADAVVDLLAAAFAAPGNGGKAAPASDGDDAASTASAEEADESLARVADAFAALLATPAVAALLAGPAGGLLAGPPARFARAKYMEAHGALVGSASYERALSTAASVLHRLQASAAYRAAAARISPLAEPYLGRVVRTPAARAVVQHLRPQAAAAATAAIACVATPVQAGRAGTPPAAAACAARG